MSDYYDMDGRRTTLYRLVRREPEWAQSRLETMTKEITALRERLEWAEKERDAAVHQIGVNYDGILSEQRENKKLKETIAQLQASARAEPVAWVYVPDGDQCSMKYPGYTWHESAFLSPGKHLVYTAPPQSTEPLVDGATYCVAQAGTIERMEEIMVAYCKANPSCGLGEIVADLRLMLMTEHTAPKNTEPKK